MKKTAISVLVILLLCAPAPADEIFFKNGRVVECKVTGKTETHVIVTLPDGSENAFQLVAIKDIVYNNKGMPTPAVEETPEPEKAKKKPDPEIERAAGEIARKLYVYFVIFIVIFLILLWLFYAQSIRITLFIVDRGNSHNRFWPSLGWGFLGLALLLTAFYGWIFLIFGLTIMSFYLAAVFSMYYQMSLVRSIIGMIIFIPVAIGSAYLFPKIPWLFGHTLAALESFLKWISG
ncbi:MAG: hypothetical protein ACYS8W_01420 [Planctomycetota bacterium]|jgi:hypothetical protein